MKKILGSEPAGRWLGVVAVAAVLAAVGCSASASDESATGVPSGDPASPGYSGGEKNSGAAAPGDSTPGASGDTSGSVHTGEGSQPAPPQSGQLTAGVWDDNLNFDFFKAYLEASKSLDGLPSYSLLQRDAARQRYLAPRAAVSELDIAFLFDTTGSMGDELSYLQSEINAIATSVKEKFPATTPRFGLVVYRDQLDDYVTRSFDFGDLNTFHTQLSQQYASGGGDYPEAVPEGLQKMTELSWRGGSVARMAFWIADAPHHAGLEQQVQSAIDAAVQKSVHVYPVAASGADARTEFTMRTTAQITGGRYLFLTDDSGIGNSHEEPHIPCYTVTRFDRAIVRMVQSEMTGQHVQPDAAEIVRTVGSPVDGKCTTQSQGQVTIY